nr:hypothetical protein [Gilliamella apicola]
MERVFNKVEDNINNDLTLPRLVMRLIVNYNHLGFLPYWLLPEVESITQKKNNTILPTYGINCNKIHQSDLLVSSKQRTVTAKTGINNANVKIIVIMKGLPII